MRKLLVVIALVFLVQPAWAAKVAGVALEEKIVNSEGTNLLLNGAGIRKKFFFSIYVAGLYLETPHKNAEEAIADSGAKRIIMHFLYDEVGKEKLVEGWNEGFSANHSSDELKVLQTRIDAFNGMFDEAMVEGDLISFDYLPGKGTRVTIKGNEKGVIEGKDFNDALLSIWLGKEPVGYDLRKELLNP